MTSKARRSRRLSVYSMAFGVVVAIFFGEAQGQEIHYFGDRPRDLDVSAKAEAMLRFPAPPFARVCQPMGVVDLYPVDGTDEFSPLALPTGVANLVPQNSQASTSTQNEPTDATDQLGRHLKLVPKKASGSATCAISLANDQVVNVRFILRDAIHKPLIEFRSNASKAKAGAAVAHAMGSLTLFKAFISGGDLSFLADETPSPNSKWGGGEDGSITSLTKSTDLARYQLVYLGGDQDAYRAWKFSGTAHKEFPTSTSIRSPKLGEVYFSAFLPPNHNPQSKNHELHSKRMVQKNDHFTFYALSRADLSPQEMMEKLP